MWLWTGAACVSCRERRKSHLITSTTHNFFFFSHIHSYSVYLDAFPKNTLLSTSPLDIPRTGKKRTDFSFLKNYFPSSPLPTATLLSSVPLPCFFFFFWKAGEVGSIFVLPGESSTASRENFTLQIRFLWLPWGRIQIPLTGNRKDSEWLHYIFFEQSVWQLKQTNPQSPCLHSPSQFCSKLAGNSGAAALRLVAGDWTVDFFFLSFSNFCFPAQQAQMLSQVPSDTRKSSQLKEVQFWGGRTQEKSSSAHQPQAGV